MKQAVTLFFLFIAAFTSQAQQIIWERSYTNSPTANGFMALTKISGTSVVVGGISENAGLAASFFTEYHANSSRPWLKFGRKLIGSDEDIQPFGKGYFFTGNLPNYTVSPAGFYIMLQRLGPQGDTLWTQKYTGTNYDVTERMMIVGNNIYLGGGDGSPGPIGAYLLLKTDTLGVLQWRRTYKAVWGTALASDLVQRPNGNIIISGWSQTANAMAKLYLVEVNASNGDSLRSAVITIKGAGYMEEHSWVYNNFSLTSDGNYICSGTIDSANYKLGYVSKIDTALNLVWSRIIRPTFGSQRMATNKVKELTNGNFALLAKDNIWGGGHMFHIFKLNPAGQVISQTTYHSQSCNNVYLNDWELLDGGTGIVAGQCLSNREAYIARIGGVGAPAVVGTPEATATKELLGQSYPNPAAMEVTIPYKVNPGVKEAELRIYEVATGRIVQVVRLDVKAQHINLKLKLLKQGVYSYTLFEDGMPTATKKMVVLK